MKRSIVAAVLAALALAPPAAAELYLGSGGRQGAMTAWQGECRYRVFGPRGVLQLAIDSPTVRGANTRRGTRRERTWVRYRVYVTDASADHATLVESSWSGWIRVRQNQEGTWPGKTLFDMDWRGNYGADIRVEWWNASRMVGWRALRTQSFVYYDQYDTGPHGPFSSCS